MNNLALTLRDQGDLPGARDIQERVVEGERRILGEEHPSTLRSKGNLALTLSDQGDVAGSRALYERILEVQRRILGEEHPNTLTSMNTCSTTTPKAIPQLLVLFTRRFLKSVAVSWEKSIPIPLYR